MLAWASCSWAGLGIIMSTKDWKLLLVFCCCFFVSFCLLFDLAFFKKEIESGKIIFPEHIPLSKLQQGIKSGNYLQGTYRASRDNYLEATVWVHGDAEEKEVSFFFILPSCCELLASLSNDLECSFFIVTYIKMSIIVIFPFLISFFFSDVLLCMDIGYWNVACAVNTFSVD